MLIEFPIPPSLKSQPQLKRQKDIFLVFDCKDDTLAKCLEEFCAFVAVEKQDCGQTCQGFLYVHQNTGK